MITHLPLGKKTGLFLLTIFLLLHTSTHAQIITTVAGGNIGDGKTATTIGLASADALVADANENIYFLDRGHNCIRRIDAATNIITTVAGGGNNTLSEGAPALSVDLFLSNIQDGIALDSHNHLYFLCFSEIVQLDLGTGLIHIVAGKINSTPSGDGGPIANATINFPLSLAVDNQDNLYFADYNSIRKVTLATGIVNTIAG
ncbi:MAG TPA: hypothetical protein VKQ52_22345, partial [Puia sp.]|nr:hypothetical protein [Puia sp.]